MRRRLLWRVFPYYVFIIVISLVAIGYYGSQQMRSLYLERVSSELQHRAMLVRHQALSLIVAGDLGSLDSLIGTLGEMTETRITIVAADGRVLADSEEDVSAMENHGQRPELLQALAGRMGTSTRYSNTLQREMKYVAVPVRSGGTVIAAVRTSFAVTTIHEALGAWTRSIVAAGLVILLLAAGISYVVFDRLSRPLRLLKAGADRFAAGNFATRLSVADTEEMGALAEAMNNMASQLQKRIATISDQRNEREAILASMTEGVIALDDSGKILSINRAAAEFFKAAAETARGRALTEVVRSAELYNLAQEMLESQRPVEREIEIAGDRTQYLQVRGAPLADAAGPRGAVFVLNDISRLKRLERMRRDFVGNVSHELRTPITAIIGSVETLIDGEVSQPEDVRRFLEILAKHASRLNTIVADLLVLSRLEAESERGGLSLRRGAVDGVIQAAAGACAENAEAHGVRVKVGEPSQLEAAIDAPKLEQAVINLIDNAIKASPPGQTVEVGAHREGDEIVIAIFDRGSGIEGRHLPRLFERFYRVDSARSRERGGTGLGLAIVKHTALGHGGRVTVESQWGQGSTFKIWLPAGASAEKSDPPRS